LWPTGGERAEGTMTRERCPKCGGRLETEGEHWHRDGGLIDRSYRCGACGSRFQSSVRWPHPVAPSDVARRGGRGLAWLAWAALFLIVLWVVLRSLDYATARVAVYSAVADAAEAFLHPGWAVALAVVAVLALIVSRRRRPPAVTSASLAPSVQLRAESPDRIAVLFSGSRGAVAHDSTVTRDPGEERRVVDAFQALARRTVAFGEREGEWRREEIEETQRELYALGLSVAHDLLGEGVAEALADLPGDHLQLGVHGELAAVPWELMVTRKGGRFLWQLFSVTRQLRDEAPAAGAIAGASGAHRVLLLANLEPEQGRTLPAAEQEAASLLELGATRPDLLRVVRKSPRDGDELRRLLREGFDVVHFAGHTGRTDDGGRGWTLGSGETVAPAELMSTSGAPMLVFANACSSGAESGGGLAESARAMMLAGAGAYLCTLAELHDSGSASFSGAFYRALVRGETLGDALTAARSALLGSHPLTWANYVLYGDPTARLL